MSYEKIFEPGDLFVVHDDLVRGILGVPKDGGTESHEKGLVRYLFHELRSGLLVRFEKDLQVLFVGFELVDPLQVVISPDDLVRHAEAAQILRRHLVTQGGAGVQLGGYYGVVVAIFGLSEVAQTHDGHVAVGGTGLVQNREPVVPSALVILHVAGIYVKVAENTQAEGRRIGRVALVHAREGRVRDVNVDGQTGRNGERRSGIESAPGDEGDEGAAGLGGRDQREDSAAYHRARIRHLLDDGEW
mmetsp:Transcript_19374/g.44139  ORF Transcript_19374/g.44139 Transcript_19374/m.44139 type:complete len:245 (-) Transcript_19374:249-983(-)